jgi:amino acid transporter
MVTGVFGLGYSRDAEPDDGSAAGFTTSVPATSHGDAGRHLTEVGVATQQTSVPHLDSRALGTRDVFVAGVALVVASTTLVSDFQGYLGLGASFAMSIGLAFIINLFLGLSASELSVASPRAGAIYEYGRDVLRGTTGSLVGLFLGMTFVGMFVIVSPGETSAGAFGLQALFNADSGLNWFILILVALAIVPNILGIRVAAWINIGLLVAMLLIRWIFGLAGFLGIGDQGSWSVDNLNTGGPGVWDWFGEGGLLASSFVLAFWTFVGIEFVCSLTEEVREPRKAMPRGIVIGLLVILGTSWLMGLGVAGTTPSAGTNWVDLTSGDAGCGGSCPQLAVGEEFFGGFGRGLMAAASITATLGSMVVALAAIPRVIYGMARDGQFFGPQLSRVFGSLHPRWLTPVPAILLFAVMSTTFALFSADVIDWIFSGAYVWILVYIAFNLLCFANRVLHPEEDHLFPRWFTVVPLIGALCTGVGLYYAYYNVHGDYLWKALIILAVAALATGIAHFAPGATDRHVETVHLTTN